MVAIIILGVLVLLVGLVVLVLFLRLRQPAQQYQPPEIYSTVGKLAKQPGTMLAAPVNQLSFSSMTKAVVEARNLKVADQACLNYLYTYLYLAQQSGVFQVPAYKKLTQDLGPVEFLAVTSVLSKGVAGFMSGAKTGGPVGGAVSAVISALTDIVGTILDSIEAERQLSLLRSWIANWLNFVGPPPVGILHLAQFIGPAKFSDFDWVVGLHAQLLSMIQSLQKIGYTFDGCQLVDSIVLQGLQDAGQLQLVGGGGWEMFKPASRLGPHYYVVFHPIYCIGSLLAPFVPGDSTGLAFYWSYVKQIKEKLKPGMSKSDPFLFTQEMFSKVMADTTGEASGFMFSIGKDPFSGHSGVSTKESDWRVKLLLPSWPQTNWLLHPAGAAP